MKAEDASRAAGLCQALADLNYETTALGDKESAESRAEADGSAHQLMAMDGRALVSVTIKMKGDGTLYRIATVEVATLRRACAVMAQITKDQLFDLGVVIE